MSLCKSLQRADMQILRVGHCCEAVLLQTQGSLTPLLPHCGVMLVTTQVLTFRITFQKLFLGFLNRRCEFLDLRGIFTPINMIRFRTIYFRFGMNILPPESILPFAILSTSPSPYPDSLRITHFSGQFSS